VIPAISFLIASWLVIISSLIAYLAFKKNIGKEYAQLQRIIGDEYIAYRKKTREIIPLPK
jgi:protein-S-isoprenylcysteine O-methyltransferase Ste14